MEIDVADAADTTDVATLALSEQLDNDSRLVSVNLTTPLSSQLYC